MATSPSKAGKAPQHVKTRRPHGAQLVHVHLFKVREPALDLLLADGRELDGELEPVYCSVSLVAPATPSTRSSRLVARLDGIAATAYALGLNDNE